MAKCGWCLTASDRCPAQEPVASSSQHRQARLRNKRVDELVRHGQLVFHTSGQAFSDATNDYFHSTQNVAIKLIGVHHHSGRLATRYAETKCRMEKSRREVFSKLGQTNISDRHDFAPRFGFAWGDRAILTLPSVTAHVHLCTLLPSMCLPPHDRLLPQWCRQGAAEYVHFGFDCPQEQPKALVEFGIVLS